MKVRCAHDAIVPISELRLNPKNPNVHTEKQIKHFAKILAHQGHRRPVRVSKQSGYVTVGHGQIAASQENGWTHVPVNYQDYDTAADEYADMVADNGLGRQSEMDLARINLDFPDIGPDLDVDLLGIDGFEIEPANKHVDGQDDVPVERPTKIKHGNIFQLGNHRLMCGSAIEKQDVLKLLSDGAADLVFTDPPYGIGKKYRSHDDSEDKWYELIHAVMPIIKACAPTAIMPCCRIKSLKWWYDQYPPDWIMCWYKGSPGHRSHVGFNDWEPHLIWGKPKNQMHDFWQTKCGHEIEGHPCPKPVEYCEWILSRAIDSHDSVLDLFGGSGTTMIAAEKLYRRCFMMEIDPVYCQVIVDRWEQFTGNKAKKL